MARGDSAGGLDRRGAAHLLPGEPAEGGGDAELPGGAGAAVGEHGVVLLAFHQLLPGAGVRVEPARVRVDPGRVAPGQGGAGARLAAAGRGDAGRVGHRRLRVPVRAQRGAARVARLGRGPVWVVSAPGGLPGGGLDAVGGGRGGLGGRAGLGGLISNLLVVVRLVFQQDDVDYGFALLGRDSDGLDRRRQGVVQLEVGDPAERNHLHTPLKKETDVKVIQDADLFAPRALIVCQESLDTQNVFTAGNWEWVIQKILSN